jgi:predicted RNA-binding Zn-ribbon protein involved in translation (DUF1610 family)
MIKTVQELIDWLVAAGSAPLFGALLLGLVLLAMVVYFRRQLRARSSMWTHACPECGSYQLQRVHRRWYDRLLNLIGIPIRRYRCPNCHWRGPLLSSN